MKTGSSSLSTWLDLESPGDHTLLCLWGCFQRVLLRRRGLLWVWLTLSCGLDPEMEFGKWDRQMSISSHVSQLPDRESDAHTPAQCSCPLVLHNTVPHSQTESQNKLVFPQVACLSVFLFTAKRITNANCWFAELSVLAGPHRLTATGRG